MHVFELITATGDRNYHAQRIWEFERVLSGRPDTLLIKMGGGGGMPASSALGYRDLMLLAGSDTQIITYGYSPLLGPDIVVWLAGHHRELLPSAFLDPLPTILEIGEPNSPGAATALLSVGPPRLPGEAWRRVEDILLESLSFDPPQRYCREELQEMGLIGGKLDRFLETIGHNEPDNQPQNERRGR